MYTITGAPFGCRVGPLSLTALLARLARPVDVETMPAVTVSPIVDVLGDPHRATLQRDGPAHLPRAVPARRHGVRRYREVVVTHLGQRGIHHPARTPSRYGEAEQPGPADNRHGQTEPADPAGPAPEGAEQCEDHGGGDLPHDGLDRHLTDQEADDETRDAEGLLPEGMIGQQDANGAE
jgi:hypothetical protein